MFLAGTLNLIDFLKLPQNLNKIDSNSRTSSDYIPLFDVSQSTTSIDDPPGLFIRIYKWITLLFGFMSNLV